MIGDKNSPIMIICYLISAQFKGKQMSNLPDIPVGFIAFLLIVLALMTGVGMWILTVAWVPV